MERTIETVLTEIRTTFNRGAVLDVAKLETLESELNARIGCGPSSRGCGFVKGRGPTGTLLSYEAAREAWFLSFPVAVA